MLGLREERGLVQSVVLGFRAWALHVGQTGPLAGVEISGSSLGIGKDANPAVVVRLLEFLSAGVERFKRHRSVQQIVVEDCLPCFGPQAGVFAQGRFGQRAVEFVNGAAVGLGDGHRVVCCWVLERRGTGNVLVQRGRAVSGNQCEHLSRLSKALRVYYRRTASQSNAVAPPRIDAISHESHDSLIMLIISPNTTLKVQVRVTTLPRARGEI